MPMPSLTRRVAAGAAAGLLLATLVCGGAATADEQDSDPTSAASIDPSTAPAPAPASAPAPAPVPAEPAPTDPVPAPPSPVAPPVAGGLPAAPADSPGSVATGGAAPTADHGAPPASAATADPAADPIADPAAPAAPAADQAAPPADPTALAAAPTVTITAPAAPASGWFTGPVDLTIDAADPDDAVASVTYRIDGGPAVETPGDTAVVQLFIEGRRTFTAWATDAAGNVSATQTRQVLIDTTGPVVDSFSSPQDRFVQRGGIRTHFTYGAHDDLSGLAGRCRVDGLTPDGDLDNSVLGEHSLEIECVDKAGNRSVTEYRWTVVDDTTPPRLSADIVGRTLGSPDWSVDENTSVVLRLDDELTEQSQLLFRVGTADWQLVSGPQTIVPITEDGVFDVIYDGYDGVGNSGGMHTLTVRRDTVAPEVALAASDEAGAPLASGASVPQGSRVVLDYDCTDATSGVASCDAGVVSGGMLDTNTPGSHEVTVTATDVAGHRTRTVFAYSVDAVVGPVPAPAPPTGAAVAAAARGAAATGLDGLAATGGSSVLPWGLAAGLLLATGSVLAARRVRRHVTD